MVVNYQLLLAIVKKLIVRHLRCLFLIATHKIPVIKVFLLPISEKQMLNDNTIIIN